MRKATDWAKVLLVPVGLAIAVAAVVGFALASCGESARADPPSAAEAQSPAPRRAAPDAALSPARPANWATPLERPGLPNLFKVSDRLYRGAQPTAEGFAELKKLGIRTVVNLRADHSDLALMDKVGLGYVSVPMRAWHPEREDLVMFLKVVTDTTRTPVFVHCQHGSDRTGEICAAYRVAVQGWAVEDAIKEMLEGGFGFHDIWRKRIGNYLRGLDYDAIRRKAGIPAPAKDN